MSTVLRMNNAPELHSSNSKKGKVVNQIQMKMLAKLKKRMQTSGSILNLQTKILQNSPLDNLKPSKKRLKKQLKMQ